MPERVEKIYKYDCDLCGKEIEDGCERSVEINKEKKYLCNDCLTAIINMIGKEEIENYWEE